ncbi:hypothetical protein DRO53_05565 [Candidatus Bathyarchaeota archaeon]|nr:MAG: hypothetical protein DRO53_05565 [Candidatus Bathyarchaeota archaeon]
MWRGLRLAEVGEAELESRLRGRTLQVYWYLLKAGSSRSFGVREVQRALGFKSPSVALHHLEKLRELGLLSKTPTGEYLVAREVKVGFLRFFMRVGRFRFPRCLLYAVFVTSLLAAYVAFYPQTLSLHNLMALVFALSASAILWFEALKALREAPL